LYAYEYIVLAKKFMNIDIDIGPVASTILLYFATQENFSVYQIFSRLESTPNRMAYKNVHKRVQRLKELAFIKRTEGKETTHKAIFYKLSEAGLFYLFLKVEKLSFIFDIPSILASYSDYEFFEAFVYHHFEKATLKSIKEVSPVNLQVVTGLFQYLKECSKQVITILEAEKKNKVDPKLKADMKFLIRSFYQTLDYKLEETEYSNGLSYLFRVFIFRMILAFGNSKDDRYDALKIFSQDKKFVKATEILNDEYCRGYGRLKQRL